MDATALWQRYQNWLYFHEGLGLYLDVSRMRFDDAFVEALQPKFDKAFADMAALEAGAIANPDEDRMVGHYWLRNPDLAPTPETYSRNCPNPRTNRSLCRKSPNRWNSSSQGKPLYRYYLHRYWWFRPRSRICG